MTKEVEKLVQELFLESVCKNYNCGSQRCDRSEEWLEGCKLYREFKCLKIRKPPLFKVAVFSYSSDEVFM